MRLIPQKLLTCTARGTLPPIAAAAWSRGHPQCVLDIMQAAAGETREAGCNFLPYA